MLRGSRVGPGVGKTLELNTLRGAVGLRQVALKIPHKPWILKFGDSRLIQPPTTPTINDNWYDTHPLSLPERDTRQEILAARVFLTNNPTDAAFSDHQQNG